MLQATDTLTQCAQMAKLVFANRHDKAYWGWYNEGDFANRRCDLV